MPFGIAVPIRHQTQGHLAGLAHPRRHLVPPLGFAVAALHTPDNLVPLGRLEDNRKVLPWCSSWTASSRPASPCHESSWSVSYSAILAGAAAVTPPSHGNRCSKSTIFSRPIGAWCRRSPGWGVRPGPWSTVGWWPRCCKRWERGIGRWKQIQRRRRSRKIPFLILWICRILLLWTATMHTETGRDLIPSTNCNWQQKCNRSSLIHVLLQKRAWFQTSAIMLPIKKKKNNEVNKVRIQTDNKVTKRYWSWSEFKTALINEYNVYSIHSI